MVLEVGIDLGTTNSVVGYFENEKVNYLKFRNEESLSSVMLYKDGKVQVGEIAKKRAIMNSKNYIQSSKAFIGDSDKSWIIDDKVFTPSDVAVEILKEIKKSLEKKFIGLSEIKAVITVPAYFTSKQIDEVKMAGESAGFNIQRVLSEPVSAAIAYGLEDEINQKLFIVDIGGGTFDTAILEVQNKKFHTLAKSGDRRLGGDDFDQHILDYLLKHIRKEHGVNLLSQIKSGLGEDEYNRAKQSLIIESEKVKIELSDYTKVDIELPNLFSGYNLKTSLTRERFEEISKSSIDKIERVISKTLSDNNFRTSDIDKVVLVGGSSKIFIIREFVENLFGMKPYSDKSLDKLVAMGATIVAHNEDTVEIRDIVAHSLGIEIVGECFSPILLKNSKYPLSQTKEYTTVIDFQESIDINVYEGEDESDVNNNDFYGGFSLENIQKAGAGIPQIEVTFSFDKNAILNVTARDLATNSSRSETIAINKGVKKKMTLNEKQFDIALVVDVSGSMYGEPLDKAKDACDLMVSEMIDLNTHKVGIVEFGSYGAVIANLSDDKYYLKKCISNINCNGSTNMADGINITRNAVLNKAMNTKLAIIVTDGYPNNQSSTENEVNKIKLDTRVITIGIGDGVDANFLQNLATQPSDYYSGSNFNELEKIFELITNSLQTL